jgi:hypothetical protein
MLKGFAVVVICVGILVTVEALAEEFGARVR